mgnify:CR=1 FL=1
MSQIDDILFQLAQIKLQLQQQSASSKKINEFDEVTDFEAGMYVAVFAPTKGVNGGVVKFPFIDKEQDLSGYQLKEFKDQQNGYAGLDEFLRVLDSERLNGQLASFYATKTSVDDINNYGENLDPLQNYENEL